MFLEKKGHFLHIIRLFLQTLLISTIVITSLWADPIEKPAPDPPLIHTFSPRSLISPSITIYAVPGTEWTYHKTPNGEHPDGNEQQMVWLMNRARSNPTQEGIWLAEMDDPDVAGARTYFNVDLNALKSEFAAIDPKPPAAFDVRLYNAAKVHSDDLIARDSQDHNNQFDRISDAGFSMWGARGNVFSYTKNALHGHAGFNIDWGGNDGTGMQDGRGHRLAIMSMDGDYSNVGLAIVSESDNSTSVGPFVTTGNYCKAADNQDNHYNRFLVGTVWMDVNSNSQYDPGEGIGNTTVTPDQGTYFAVTSDSGGYAIPVSDGTYTVTISGPTIDVNMTQTVTVGSQSVLVDYLYTGNVPEAFTLQAGDITQTSAGLVGSITTYGIECDYYFEYGETTNYGSETTIYQTSSDGQVNTTVSDLAEKTTYHYRLVLSYSSDTIYGDDQTLVTLAEDAIPEVVTLQAGDITQTSAGLAGSITAYGIECDYYFEYGETTNYGSETNIYQTSSDGQVNTTVSDLAENTTYHYRLVLSYDSKTIHGNDQTLLTLAEDAVPEATTLQAGAIKKTSANLGGSITTNGIDCDYYFEYGETTNYGNTTPTHQISSDNQVNHTVYDLTENTTYHYRLVLDYDSNTVYGNDQTLVTFAEDAVPEVVTLQTDTITQETAGLTGSITTNGNECDYFFEYGETNNYGSTTNIYQISSDDQVNTTVSGLTEDTTYHYRLVINYDSSTIYGNNQTLVTLSEDEVPNDGGDGTGSSGDGGGGGCFIGSLSEGIN